MIKAGYKTRPLSFYASVVTASSSLGAFGRLLASIIAALLIFISFESFLANFLELFSISLFIFFEPSPNVPAISFNPVIKLNLISFSAVFLADLTSDLSLLFFTILSCISNIC